MDTKKIVEIGTSWMSDTTIAMVLVTIIGLSSLVCPPSAETLELIEKIIICMGSLAVGRKIGK